MTALGTPSPIKPHALQQSQLESTAAEPDVALAPIEPPPAGTHTLERVNHLFRRSLTAHRVHPLHAAILKLRELAP